ncbi:MAG: MaoC/PaaZ C-terminal domain-containing protein [Anaeromyxobacter sp.]
MLTARQLYFEAVKVGDELPPLVKPPVDRLQIARWVGAAGDFNPLFIDEPHAKQSGFPSVLVPWMIAMGFVAELGNEWVRGARLRKFSARFVKIVWPGDVLTARGRVSERRFEDGGKYSIDLELWAENQRGELVVRGVATWQLFYSAEDEAKQRAGQPPLVVTREEEEARLAKLSRAQPQRPAAPQSRPLQPPRPVAAAAPAQQRQPGPSPAAIAALAGRGPAPIVRPANAKPPPQVARKPEPRKKPGAKKPAAKRSAGKAKVARPRPAKRAEKKDRARARARPPAKKPSGKKRR